MDNGTREVSRLGTTYLRVPRLQPGEPMPSGCRAVRCTIEREHVVALDAEMLARHFSGTPVICSDCDKVLVQAINNISDEDPPL